MNVIDTDYLVVGAGAAGMAFVDALIAACDADVVMVDRHEAPGGHWNHAYPFVRLHQPSAIYGVNSRRLGTDSLDTIGTDTGLYERATGAEISGYFRSALDQILLPSGQVRFFGLSDYVATGSGEHVFTSRLTGASTRVNVRRKVVDTTYLQVTVPAAHIPSFAVDPGVQFFPVGELAHIDTPPGGFNILGGGKTSMDACFWLLCHGVDPERIRWIRPRDSWVLDRRCFQPLDLIADTVKAFATALEVLADAEDMDDLFRKIEAHGLMWRLDEDVEPTLYRGAILSPTEFNALKQVRRVVRKGHIKRITRDRIYLDGGEIPTDPTQVHVDCTARGIHCNPAIPIFGSGRIVLQGLVGGFTTFSSALIGYVEATRDDDSEKNRLCIPVSPLSRPSEWIDSYSGLINVAKLQDGVDGASDIAEWLEGARLNMTAGIAARRHDNALANALARVSAATEPAVQNGQRLLRIHLNQSPIAAPRTGRQSAG